jgi:hypothetical protein
MNQKDVIVLANFLPLVLLEKDAIVPLIASYTGALLIIPSQYLCQDPCAGGCGDEQPAQAGGSFRSPEWYDERAKGGIYR